MAQIPVKMTKSLGVAALVALVLLSVSFNGYLYWRLTSLAEASSGFLLTDLSTQLVLLREGRTCIPPAKISQLEGNTLRFPLLLKLSIGDDTGSIRAAELIQNSYLKTNLALMAELTRISAIEPSFMGDLSEIADDIWRKR